MLKNLKYFFIIIICIKLSTSLTGQFPQIKLSPKNSMNELFFTANLCLGTPGDQCFDFRIDFSSFYITLVQYNETLGQRFIQTFNPSNSKTFVSNENDTISLSSSLTGVKATDTLLIEKALSIPEISFILTNDLTQQGSQYDGTIGLGYRASSSSEEEYSLLDQLFLKKIITHRVFYIDFSVSSYRPQLFIGDLPNIVYKDYQHYGYCDLLQKKINSQQYNENWQCLVKKVYFPSTNDTFTEETPILFSLNSTNLLLPMIMINKLKNEYYHLLEQKLCNFRETEYTAELYCKLGAKIPSLFIEFEKWKLEIPGNLLMAGGFGTFMKIATISSKINQIILGQKILQNLTVIYDRENDQVGFYSSDFITYIGEGELKKPDFQTRHEPSVLSRERGDKNKYEEIKGKVTGTLWLFGGLCIATLIVVGVLFFLGNKKEEKKVEEESIEPIYTNDNELIDLDLNTSHTSESTKYAINH